MRRAAIAAALACLAVTGCGPEPLEPLPERRFSRLPATGTTPLDLPAWGPDDVGAAADWPLGCDLLPDAELRRILPQVTELARETADLSLSTVRLDGADDGSRVRLPGGECRRDIWLEGTQPGDRGDLLVRVTPLFAGGEARAEANYLRNRRETPCGAEVAEELLVSCSFDPRFAEYVVRKNGVVFTVLSKASAYTTGRWEDQGDGDFAEYFQFTVVPALIDAIAARIP